MKLGDMMDVPKTLLAGLMVVFPLVLAGAAFAQTEPGTVAEAVGVIRGQSDIARKVGLTIDLAGAIKAGTYAGIGDADIDALAVLLDDDNDVERMWATAALYQTGPAAVRAVPALLKAYERIRCDTRYVTSKSAIEETLKGVGVVPPARTCP